MKRCTDRSKYSRGQALVEAALFFPIMLVILAGVVEVSQLTITQNRVTEAARASARFGAYGGQDLGMVNTVFNAVTQTLGTDELVWDMWTIRATIDDSGTAYQNWEFSHTYGFSNTVRASEVSEAQLKQEVLAELQTDQNGISSFGIAGGLDIVGVYLIHDVESILGLEAVPALQGFNSLAELSVMRITGQEIEQTEGCSAFPIAVHEGVRSVTPPGEGASPYPDSGDFDYPDSPPAYSDFYNHTPNVPLSGASEGDIFFIQQGFGNGNFGWLLWNEGRPGNAGSLADSLTWPGDSTDYTDHGDHQIHEAAYGIDHIVRGYVEPGDGTDTSLHVQDWVAANTGSKNGNEVRNAVATLAAQKQDIRVIIWDESDEQGSNGKYRVAGFAIFKLHGYHLSQGNGGSWILAEFIRLDTTCGQRAD